MNFVEIDGHNVSSDGGGGSAPAPRPGGGGVSGFLGDRLDDAQSAARVVKRKVQRAAKSVSARVRQAWRLRNDAVRYIHDRVTSAAHYAAQRASNAANAAYEFGRDNIADPVKGAVGLGVNKAAEYLGNVRRTTTGVVREGGKVVRTYAEYAPRTALRLSARAAGGIGGAGGQLLVDYFGPERPWTQYLGRAALSALTGAASAAVGTVAFAACLPGAVVAIACGAGAAVFTSYVVNRWVTSPISKQLGWGEL